MQTTTTQQKMEDIGPRQIQRALKLRGLEIRPNALKAIQSVLKREANRAGALDILSNALKERITLTNASCIVDEDLVKQVVLALSKNEEDDVFDSIKIIHAFSIPISMYNPSTRTFQVLHDTDNNRPRSLQGPAESKSQLLRSRLAFVHQKTMRNSLFKPQAAMGRATTTVGRKQDQTIMLTPIDQLAAGGGDSAQLHHVLGVLTRIDDHRFWIEDANGRLPLDLAQENMAVSHGFFTVGCVVIATGHLVSLQDGSEEDDANGEANNKQSSAIKYVFRVDALVMPPKEDRKDSEIAHPGCARRMLGLPDLSHREEQHMSQMEVEAEDTFFVMLSDVHLDDPDTFDSLRKVFEGFADTPPQLFVLIGNFSRKPFALSSGNNSAEFISPREFGDLFEDLAELLLEVAPSLLTEKTRWVFVPGPRDPSLSPQQALPRPSIPADIARRFTDLLPSDARVTFTTNPCRILFYNHELCIFRNDSMSQMRRNCVLNTKTGTDEHLVRTLCTQAHLCPVIDSRPFYLPYCESSLRLFPLPHLVVMADNYDQYQWNNDGCVVMNPGSFSSDGSFVVYLPAQEKIEFSRVDRGVQQRAEAEEE